MSVCLSSGARRIKNGSLGVGVQDNNLNLAPNILQAVEWTLISPSGLDAACGVVYLDDGLGAPDVEADHVEVDHGGRGRERWVTSRSSDAANG